MSENKKIVNTPEFETWYAEELRLEKLGIWSEGQKAEFNRTAIKVSCRGKRRGRL